jgi:hypothetical protein
MQLLTLKYLLYFTVSGDDANESNCSTLEILLITPHHNYASLIESLTTLIATGMR